MNKDEKIYIAGHKGLAGSAILRKLQNQGYKNIIYKSHQELDLTQQHLVDKFFEIERPNYVILAAAKVGGIYANNIYPAEFIYNNLMIECNVIHSAYRYGVMKLLFLASSCIYPKNVPQPIKEEYLLYNYLDSNHEAYAIAKIAGIKLCQYYKKQYGVNFISCVPTNLYGPNDNFDLKNSHVIPALIRKFHDAKINNAPYVEVWGTGKPMREIIHVDDLADACLFLMNNYDGDMWINVGSGEEVSIAELANIIKEVIGYKGEIVFNTNYPDGPYRKLLDINKLTKLGWQKKINLVDGLKSTYEWYCNNIKNV
ncbi:GDP-L-fucose synthase family protein [Caldicellulosiruptoraceae bacterium PP1]